MVVSDYVVITGTPWFGVMPVVRQYCSVVDSKRNQWGLLDG